MITHYLVKLCIQINYRMVMMFESYFRLDAETLVCLYLYNIQFIHAFLKNNYVYFNPLKILVLCS